MRDRIIDESSTLPSILIHIMYKISATMLKIGIKRLCIPNVFYPSFLKISAKWCTVLYSY